MTALEVVVSPIPPLSEMEVAWKLASRISGTDFVPREFRGRPEAVLAAILTGRELGIGPMQSLQSIHVIQGKPGLSPELMRGLVLGAGHSLILTPADDVATLECRRADWPEGRWQTFTWTLEDARRAGLGGDSWKKYPRAMLAARVTSEACRMVFPDVISGLSYTPEELGSIDEPALAPVPAVVEPEPGPEPEIVDAEVVVELPDLATFDGDPAPKDPLTRMTRGELVAQCEARGLGTDGDRKVLVTRIVDHDSTPF